MENTNRYEHNFDRYKTVGGESYDAKGLTYYVLRYPADRIIIPLIERIQGRHVIDVGCGTGYYSVLFPTSNTVTGVDINPHLATHSGLKVIEARAEDFARRLPKEIHADLVFSAWMTEYLDARALSAFFENSYTVLPKGGMFVSTIIGTWGLGFAYVFLARHINGVKKYSHAASDVVRILERIGFINIKIIPLRSWAWIPFGYMVSAGKL